MINAMKMIFKMCLLKKYFFSNLGLSSIFDGGRTEHASLVYRAPKQPDNRAPKIAEGRALKIVESRVPKNDPKTEKEEKDETNQVRA